MDEQNQNEIILRHANSPTNRGMLADPSGTGSAGNGGCDQITFYVRVGGDRISDVSFQCQGCPASVACGSVASELAKGRHLDEAAEISAEVIAGVLGGLDREHLHCAELAAEGLANAIWDYVINQIEERGPTT